MSQDHGHYRARLRNKRTIAQEIIFIIRLGCNSHHSETEMLKAIKLRSNDEYLSLLKSYIEVHEKSDDLIFRAGVRYAQEQIKRNGQ